MIVDILGVPYEVTRNTKEVSRVEADGLCRAYDRQIVYRELKDFLGSEDSNEAKVERRNEVVRHEVIHAFFYESGLSGYGNDEVLVDWIAKQLPNIEKATLKILEAEDCKE